MRIILLSFTFIFFSCVDSSQKKNDFSIQSISKIDTYIEDKILNNQIPGTVILVKKNDKIVHFKSYGYSNFNKKIKFKNNDIFRIASMTKIMTSIAVLQLVEDNKISLTDPIENFIPEFKNLNVIESFDIKDGTFTARPAKNKITLKHLLTHSSGLTYGSYDDIPSHSEIYSKAGIIELFTTDSISQSENVKKLASLPLLFEPGESFKYGLNIDVVGHLIEIISGKSLSDYFKTFFFDPLEMRDTYFYIPESKKKRLVPIQTNIDGFWKIYDAEKYDVDYPLKGKEFFSGGAGLSSTVTSFSKFLQMICDGGVYKNKRIISSNIIESLKENHVEHLVEDLSHGLASGITTDLDVKKGFTGNTGSIYWDGMFSTSFFIDPSENLVFLIFRQLQDTEDDVHLIVEDLREIIQAEN